MNSNDKMVCIIASAIRKIEIMTCATCNLEFIRWKYVLEEFKAQKLRWSLTAKSKFLQTTSEWWMDYTSIYRASRQVISIYISTQQSLYGEDIASWRHYSNGKIGQNVTCHVLNDASSSCRCRFEVSWGLRTVQAATWVLPRHQRREQLGLFNFFSKIKYHMFLQTSRIHKSTGFRPEKKSPHGDNKTREGCFTQSDSIFFCGVHKMANSNNIIWRPRFLSENPRDPQVFCVLWQIGSDHMVRGPRIER